MDPEVLMDAANRKFESRFGEMERLLAVRAVTLEAATPDQMEDAWTAAKAQETKATV